MILPFGVDFSQESSYAHAVFDSGVLAFHSVFPAFRAVLPGSVPPETATESAVDDGFLFEDA